MTYWGEARFLDCAAHLGIDAFRASIRYDDLKHCYGEAGRYYHNFEHIRASFEELEEAKRENLITEITIVEWALFYHDCIYSVFFPEPNELLSAQKAAYGIRSPSVAAMVRELILATKHDVYVLKHDERAIQDIDLAILGKDPDTYDAYATKIRAEYGHVKQPVYDMARIQVLQGFLDNTRVYRTDFFRERYETQARENMLREIVELKERDAAA